MPFFSYKIKPSRDNFIETVTEEESNIIGEHFTYLQKLLASRELVMAGRTDGGEYGIAIFECKTEERAREIALADPAVVKGVFIAEFHKFHIALFRDIK